MKHKFLAWLICLALVLSCLPMQARAESGDGDWQLVGQTGGTTKALLAEGTVLYVGTGLHVLILDVSKPAEMRVLGTSPLLPDFVESIASDGAGKLFVACGLGGLIVLDVQNPSQPALIGSLDTRGYTEGVALLDDYALVVDGPQGLQIVDVRDPAQMKTVAEAYPLAYAYDVVTSGRTAYLAGGGSGVFAVDLSDPLHPKEAGLTPLDGFTYDLELLDGKLYAACAWGGVSMLNIATPLMPKRVASTQTSGWAMALCSLGKDLLVLDGADGAMIMGVAPTALVPLSTYTLGGFAIAGAVSGATAFVLDSEKGLLALDLTKKREPALICRWMPLLEARRLTMQDGVCYVAGGLSGMHVFDMANTASPVESYWYDTAGGYANQVMIGEGVAYLTTHLATKEPLTIFDLADALLPQKIGVLPNDESVFNSAFRAICMGENALLIAGEQCDITVNIDDLTKPYMMDRLDLENPVNADSSGSLMISTNSYALQLVDASDPGNLRLISQLPKNSGGEAIRFINPTTVITSADPGIWIVDVSDPKNPRKISELKITGSVMDIFLDGTSAYLCNLGDGIQVVDLSDLHHPVLTDSFVTIGLAYDCFVKDGLVYVADSFAGMTIYQKGERKQADDTTAVQSAPVALSLKTGDAQYSLNLISSNQPVPTEAFHAIVTSAADSGAGTLRDALEHLRPNTTITFDQAVFPADHPATILLESPLPEIVWDYLTIDASNAGVILDGGKLESGSGLLIYSFYNRIMGLQIVNFPQHGIDLQGGDSVIGGNRNEGIGPMGQGNLLSGNRWYGIRVGGFGQTLLGNYVGVDLSGEKAFPNFNGIFISEAKDITVGSVISGEGNIISGNKMINIDSWGDHTRIIGNIIGLNASGTKAISTSTASNVTLESNVMNTIVGGTTPGERNIISGANFGVVFSDPNSYQCAVIGNYIGTDITGTKAIPNHDGILMWTSGNHRVGGTRAGEGNLISGNQNGVQLNGYGVTDNIVIGNVIGYDANGKPLPNETAVSINMGQKHAIIGGYTEPEGNRIYGGSISMRITDRGIQACYIAGNFIDNPKGMAIYLENGANRNFVQGNTVSQSSGNSLRVDYGEGNMLRANLLAGSKPQEIIQLLEGGNRMLSAPELTASTPEGFSGKTVPFGRVETYLFEAGSIRPLGFTDADSNGAFVCKYPELTVGKRFVLLVTDTYGNTSPISTVFALSVN